MEIRINIKQLVFVSVWLLIIIVALLLSTTRPYMDLLGKAEKFGWLFGILGASITVFVIGYNFLQNDQEQDKTCGQYGIKTSFFIFNFFVGFRFLIFCFD